MHDIFCIRVRARRGLCKRLYVVASDSMSG